jgi:prepilin-type processing-associated H-X9-DG protein
MYIGQYRYYPGAWARYEGAGGYGYAIWPTRLRAFLGAETGVFQCPSQDERCAWRPDGPPRGPVGRASEAESAFGYEIGESLIAGAGSGDTWFSYGYNHFGANGSYFQMAKDGSLTHYGLGIATNWTATGRIGGELPASRVRNPVDMIAIADSTADGRIDFLLNPYPETALIPGTPHQGGANVLFCDGHVQWHRPSEVSYVNLQNTPYGLELFRRITRMWNNDNRHPSDP